MDIEKAFKAMLEQQVRQSEALEGIYSCLQVLVKRGEVVISSQSVEGAAPSADGDVDDEAAETKPPSRGSRRQAKNQERPEPEPEAAEEEPEVDPLDEGQAPPPKEPTADDVKAALSAYRNINGTPAMMKLFAKYGASGMGTLKPESYADIIADAK